METHKNDHFFTKWDHTRGGYTLVANMEGMTIGIAVCSPGDQYCRKEGVRLAKERADFMASTRPPDQVAMGIVGILVPRMASGKAGLFQRGAMEDALEYAREYFPDAKGYLMLYEQIVEDDE